MRTTVLESRRPHPGLERSTPTLSYSEVQVALLSGTMECNSGPILTFDH